MQVPIEFTDFISSRLKLDKFESKEAFMKTITNFLLEWDQQRLCNLKVFLEEKVLFCQRILEILNPDDAVSKLLSSMLPLLRHMTQNCQFLPMLPKAKEILLSLRKNVVQDLHILINESSSKFNEGDLLEVCNAVKNCYEDTNDLIDLFENGEGGVTDKTEIAEEIYNSLRRG